MVATAAFDPFSIRRAEHFTLSHESAAWRSVRADLIRRTGVGRQETSITADDHTILLNVGGMAKEGEDYVDGRRIAFTQRRVGSLSFIPANHTWTGWDNGDPTASHLVITIDKRFISDHFENVPGVHLDRLTPALGFQDPPAQFAARRIRSEISLQDPLSILQVESHAAIIFGQLFRLSGQRRPYLKGGLAPKALHDILEKIETSLDRVITLADLARQIGLSEYHMCRAFRLSMGTSPHAFISQRRLERASDMLRFSSHSITEIASLCGYYSSSHFSSAFRREMSISPTQYRTAWKK